MNDSNLVNPEDIPQEPHLIFPSDEYVIAFKIPIPLLWQILHFIFILFTSSLRI